jgi:hypothetical protein
MNLIELDRALKQLRLGGMAAVLETVCARHKQSRSPPSICSRVWSPTNSPGVVSACWNGEKSRPSSATPRRPSTTSTSPSIRR